MHTGNNDKFPGGSGRKFKRRGPKVRFDYACTTTLTEGRTAILHRLRSAFEAYHAMGDDELNRVLSELKQGTILIQPSPFNPDDALVLGLNEGLRLVVRHCHGLDAVEDIERQLREGYQGRKIIVLADGENELAAQKLRSFLIRKDI